MKTKKSMIRRLAIYIIIIVISLFLVIIGKGQTPALQWVNSVGGTGIDMGFGVAVDASGNVYSTGRFEGVADFDPGAATFNLTSTGGNDIFVLKLNSSGGFVWAKKMGSTGDDQGFSIALDEDGNVYTTGWFQNTGDFDPGAGTFNLTSAGSFDVFISKLDNAGNFLWAKRVGASDGDAGWYVAADASGNAYVSGFYDETVDFDPGAGVNSLTSTGPGTQDIFIMKLDASGDFVWVKGLGGNDNGDDGFAIDVDAAGNVYATGSYELSGDFDPGAGVFNLNSEGGEDIFIVKLDPSGNLVWAKSIGGTDDDRGLAIKVAASGFVYATGAFSLTADFDPGAGSFDLTSEGDEDIFVLKLDAAGDLVWAKSMGSADTDEAESGISLAVDPSGAVYTTGFFAETTDFDPGAGVYDLTAASRDVFVSKLDASGNFAWAISVGGSSLDRGNSIAVHTSGRLYIVGSYLFTVDFDPGPGVFNVTYAGNAALNSDGFILTLNPASTGIAITDFSPSSGPIGTVVTITGTNFSATPADNVVRFNGTIAPVSASTTTSVVTTVPAGALTGTISVTVAGNTAVSADNFSVTQASNQPPVINPATSDVPVDGILTVDLLQFISDPDGNLDLSTLEIITSPASGASASIDSDQNLVIDYRGISFSGTEGIVIGVCDLAGACVQEEFIVEVAGELIVYNGMSPNGDQRNDFFFLKNIALIEDAKLNHVFIYSRWGDLIFDVRNYDNESNVFTGLSNKGKEIPPGTYFYRIEFTGSRKMLTGYLTIKP